MTKLEDFKLKLAEGCRLVDRGDGTAVAVDAHCDRRLVLNAAEAALAADFSGVPLSEIAYKTFVKQGRIPFAKLKGLCRNLALRDMLEHSAQARDLFA
ncbi:MAG: hypothetical protein QME74_03550, partial [Candidatus Edwardsbacteria bacterium]|nr:hypothetical protein [Candidatus Edwardsbacteria bacterium]